MRQLLPPSSPRVDARDAATRVCDDATLRRGRCFSLEPRGPLLCAWERRQHAAAGQRSRASTQARQASVFSPLGISRTRRGLAPPRRRVRRCSPPCEHPSCGSNACARACARLLGFTCPRPEQYPPPRP
eukprot:356123-Chlamydomonas_euryale.AAC.10